MGANNQRKLGRDSAHRKALLRNQASFLLWYGRIETTLHKAKEVRSYAEKIITLAVNSYTDVTKVKKQKVNVKGNKVTVDVVNDGPKRLNARRLIMSKVYDLQELQHPKEKKAAFKARTRSINHPLVEKIFNEYAPRYAKRKEETGQGGGYTRIIKLGRRQGDNAEIAILELV
ncbi:MAG: 50S ribosomal protein L17 [Firmicutes bacterium]|nr:50S ribosomal protein L17 [Bacillota bacterium]